MTDKIVVFSTCDSEEQAGRVARALVEQRLAACVNILSPVRSIYRWKGQIEDAAEWMLIIKSRRDLMSDCAPRSGRSIPTKCRSCWRSRWWMARRTIWRGSTAS